MRKVANLKNMSMLVFPPGLCQFWISSAFYANFRHLYANLRHLHANFRHFYANFNHLR